MVLRADIDALAMEDLKTVPYHSENPGVCHACGHDAHAATLLTAARILKSKEAEFSGQIPPVFPAGRGDRSGSPPLCAGRTVRRCGQSTLGAHVSSRLESGKIALTAGPQNASCDYFKIKVTGRGAQYPLPIWESTRPMSPHRLW